MLNGVMSDVTQILQQIDAGDSSAAEKLLPLVYDELRKLASARMVHESKDNTLQATALVHEAYIRLVDVEQAQRWHGRGHFFAAAAEAMRRILVESARRKQNLKDGGAYCKVELTDVADYREKVAWELIALDEALTRFEAIEPQKAQLIKHRYFAGLSLEDTAAALGISVATAKRHWIYARAWLYGELNGRNSSGKT
jgi:RNA polymerase sigma factor (TIGR02999 family)